MSLLGCFGKVPWVLPRDAVRTDEGNVKALVVSRKCRFVSGERSCAGIAVKTKTPRIPPGSWSVHTWRISLLFCGLGVFGRLGFRGCRGVSAQDYQALVNPLQAFMGWQRIRRGVFDDLDGLLQAPAVMIGNGHTVSFGERPLAAPSRNDETSMKLVHQRWCRNRPERVTNSDRTGTSWLAGARARIDWRKISITNANTPVLGTGVSSHPLERKNQPIRPAAWGPGRCADGPHPCRSSGA